MTDEVTPAPEETQDTPTPEAEAPQEETPKPVVDWESRYNNLRPQFDRTNQRLAELEEERQALQAQQPEEEDDEEFLYEDPVARQRLAELEARLAQRDEQDTLARQAAEEKSYIEGSIAALEEELGEEFSDEEFDWLGHRVHALPKDDEGKPDVRRAYEQYSSMLEARKQKWVEGKKKPSKPASGPGAAQLPDLSSKKGRIAHIDERIAQLQQ